MATYAAYGKTFLIVVLAAFLYYFFWISVLPFMRILDGEYARVLHVCVCVVRVLWCRGWFPNLFSECISFTSIMPFFVSICAKFISATETRRKGGKLVFWLFRQPLLSSQIYDAFPRLHLTSYCLLYFVNMLIIDKVFGFADCGNILTHTTSQSTN